MLGVRGLVAALDFDMLDDQMEEPTYACMAHVHDSEMEEPADAFATHAYDPSDAFTTHAHDPSDAERVHALVAALDDDELDAQMLSELLDADDTEAVATELAAAAAMAEAEEASNRAAGDAARLYFEDAAAVAGCQRFAAALRSTGLLEQLPGLSRCSDAPAAVRLTVFGPSDAALAALPPSAWHDASQLRSLLRLHICAGEVSTSDGDALSMVGHSHRLQRIPLSHALASIGNAHVAAPPVSFCAGAIYPIDSVLWGLELLAPCR